MSVGPCLMSYFVQFAESDVKLEVLGSESILHYPDLRIYFTSNEQLLKLYAVVEKHLREAEVLPGMSENTPTFVPVQQLEKSFRRPTTTEEDDIPF